MSGRAKAPSFRPLDAGEKTKSIAEANRLSFRCGNNDPAQARGLRFGYTRAQFWVLVIAHADKAAEALIFLHIPKERRHYAQSVNWIGVSAATSTKSHSYQRYDDL